MQPSSSKKGAPNNEHRQTWNGTMPCRLLTCKTHTTESTTQPCTQPPQTDTPPRYLQVSYSVALIHSQTRHAPVAQSQARNPPLSFNHMQGPPPRPRPITSKETQTLVQSQRSKRRLRPITDKLMQPRPIINKEMPLSSNHKQQPPALSSNHNKTPPASSNHGQGPPPARPITNKEPSPLV